MANHRTFRVGITPDWGQQTFAALRQAIAEILEPLPHLEFEVMPDTGDVARAEIIDQYDANLVLGTAYPKESFEGVKRLACLARWGVGYDRIDMPAATKAGVMVALTPGGVRRPVAEGILALIFATAKSVRAMDARVRGGRWRNDLECTSINIEGRTLGSVGAGNIAGELFKMARGVGFGRLLAYDPFVQPARAAGMGVELVDLDTLMRASDFVTINTPLNDKTKGLIGARELGLMKRSAYLINTARGPVVDEKALIEALQQRRIAGAGLDVFEQEPPGKDNPLLQLDNVILAPHAIAWTEECVEGNSREACLNVKAVYEGNAPAVLADPAAVERPELQAKLAQWRKA
jgi:phosphoglycerate dehydrogenase-like enzyme